MNVIRLQWRTRSYSWLGRTQQFMLWPFVYTLLLALCCTALFHAPFLAQLQQKIPGQYGLQATLWLVLLLLNSLFFTLLSLPGLPRLQRVLLTSFFLIAAISHYFISHFGTVIDRAMLQNVLETDLAEASALLNPDLVATTMGWLLLLSWLNWKIAFKPQAWRLGVRQWLLSLVLISSSLGAIAATQYAELASFFRNYRDVKYYALPLSPLSATVAVSKQQIATAFPPHFQQLATDVHVLAPATTPRTLVLVLGETARADHFQLNGYQRPTNPRLSELPVVSFSQVSACGTATAHSVPCMFSEYIVNAYDNSLLATDALLADAITQLTQLPNSALLYVSDHGESLGENGVYLHGLPYWMAPKAQTGVPLIWWMSPSFASNQALNLSCLQQKKQQPLSHDHLFHSLPALFARASSAFKAELNLFASCTAV